LFLQAGKYFLLATLALIICILAVAVWRKRSSERNAQWVPLVAVAGLGATALAKGLAFESTNSLELGFMFALMVPLGFLSFKWGISTSVVTKIVAYFAVIAVVVNLIQIGLFFATNRLPALGYYNSTSVRFGSVFDDPNGFAILIPLLIPVVLLWVRIGWSRFVLVALLVLSLVATQSFTGIVAAVGTLFVGFIAINWGKAKRIIIFVSSFVVVGGIGLAVLLSSKTFWKVLETKQGSIEAHSGSLDVVFALSPRELLGYGDPVPGIESSYVSLVTNYGLLFTVVYTALGLWAIVRYFLVIRSAPSLRDVPIHCGFFFFLIAYLVVSINLQAEAMFPANLVYAFAIGFAFFVSNRAAPETDSETVPEASRRSHQRVNGVEARHARARRI
jgi:hypothetical protein